MLTLTRFQINVSSNVLRSSSRCVAWTTGWSGESHATLREGLCSLARRRRSWEPQARLSSAPTSRQQLTSVCLSVQSSIFFIAVRFSRCHSSVVAVTSSINWSSSQFCLNISSSADTWGQRSDSSASLVRARARRGGRVSSTCHCHTSIDRRTINGLLRIATELSPWVLEAGDGWPSLHAHSCPQSLTALCCDVNLIVRILHRPRYKKDS